MSKTEGCWRVKSHRGWWVLEKRERYLKRKTSSLDVKAHSQLGCQMGDFTPSHGALSAALCSMSLCLGLGDSERVHVCLLFVEL